MGRYTRTKVVATIGPACASRAMVLQLARAGVSVFRLNFSHGSHESHAEAIAHIRGVEEQTARPLAILADLSGPKLRLGDVPGGEREAAPGEVLTFTSRRVRKGDTRIPVQIKALHKHLREGQHILIDDGLVRLRVLDTASDDIRCRVENLNSCVIRSRKGVNLPGAHLPIPAVTAKDKADMLFALGAGVDFVALSFVRSAADVRRARRMMKSAGRSVPIIAKIEQAEAVEELDAILDEADGAMVARGDLGVEIPIHEVPSVQFRIIEGCNARTKPVITATQMLNSMITNPVPTRAEVTDIYNAILDGTDAVMLSGETAAGAYPVECVEVMQRVAREAEKNMRWRLGLGWRTEPGQTPEIPEAVCESAVMLAEQLRLDAIVCPTQSGATALRVARFRPKCQIFSCSTDLASVRRLCLTWGVRGRAMRELWGTEEESGEADAIIAAAIKAGLESGVLKKKMRVVVLAGLPLRVPGHTNLLRVLEVGG
ncbi:pyruvate kinase [Candidatus Poribacteria bacterium]|nr:pyruvate kinase [Candidatus Poribacteria bacterium]